MGLNKDILVLFRNLIETVQASLTGYPQQIAGTTMQNHLNLRLNRARDLLMSTVLKISEIAEHTGFDSVFYFSKMFKKKNGVSPKFYRSTGI